MSSHKTSQIPSCSLGALTLGEVSYQVVETFKQPYGVVHVAQN